MKNIFFLFLIIIFFSCKENKTYTYKEIKEYSESVNIVNTDTIVKNAITDFKYYIINSDITNKENLLNTLDSLIVVYKDSSDIITSLNNKVNSKYDNENRYFILLDYNIMFIDKNKINYYDILHELNHLVKDYKIDNFYNLLNFDLDYSRQNFNVVCLTNGIHTLNKDIINDNYIDYIRDTFESYPRIEILKMFLYNNDFISDLNNDISDEIIYDLYTGRLYEKMNEKQRNEFNNTDFFTLLLFFDYNKYPMLKFFLKDIFENHFK